MTLSLAPISSHIHLKQFQVDGWTWKRREKSSSEQSDRPKNRVSSRSNSQCYQVSISCYLYIGSCDGMRWECWALSISHVLSFFLGNQWNHSKNLVQFLTIHHPLHPINLFFIFILHFFLQPLSFSLSPSFCIFGHISSIACWTMVNLILFKSTLGPSSRLISWGYDYAHSHSLKWGT